MEFQSLLEKSFQDLLRTGGRVKKIELDEDVTKEMKRTAEKVIKDLDDLHNDYWSFSVVFSDGYAILKVVCLYE
jgi:hypothetical protein